LEEKISKWILSGRFPKNLNEAERRAYGIFTYRNNKPLDDTDAVVLLPVLVVRGYYPELYYSTDSDGFSAWYFTETPGQPYFLGRTVAEAVTAAVSVLAESI